MIIRMAVLGAIGYAIFSDSSNSTNTSQASNENKVEEKNFDVNYPIYTKVTGVTFNGRQTYVRNCYSGQHLRLERDYGNSYDKNAIAVYANYNQVGFVSKELAEKLAPAMDKGMELEAIVQQVTGGGSYSYGLNIKIIEQISSSNSYRTVQETSYEDEYYYSDYDYDDDDPEAVIQRRYGNDPCDADPDMCCGYDH